MPRLTLSRLAFLKQSGGSSNHPELRNPIAGFDERRAEPGRALGSHTKEPAFPGGGRAALPGAQQHSGRSDAPGTAGGSPAARPLCWWLGEVSHPQPEPDQRPSAERPGNEEGGNPVPGAAGRRREERGARGAREDQSPRRLDRLARSSKPERTGVRRGKTCGRNFLPRGVGWGGG